MQRPAKTRLAPDALAREQDQNARARREPRPRPSTARREYSRSLPRCSPPRRPNTSGMPVVGPGSSGHTHPLSASPLKPRRASGPGVRGRSLSRHSAESDQTAPARAGTGQGEQGRASRAEPLDSGEREDWIRRETQKDRFM